MEGHVHRPVPERRQPKESATARGTGLIRTGAARRRRHGIAKSASSAAGQHGFSQDLFDDVPALIASVGPDLRYRDANQKYCEWFDMSPDRLRGRHVREVLGEAQLETLGGHMRRALAGERVSFEHRLQCRQGRMMWIAGTYIPEVGPDGTVRGFYAVLSDVDDRKRADDALRRSNAHFRRLYESNIIGVMIADIHGNIHDCNDEFLRIIGYSRVDLPLRWIDMTPPEWLPLDEAAIEQCKTKGVVPTWEKEYVRKDGSRIPILLAVAMLDMEAGTCICPVLDLSDRARLEKALLEQSETERRRLGQDLHDGLGQHLTGLAFLTKALEERLQNGGSAAAAKHAAKIAKLAEEAVSKARSLAQLVCPVDMRPGGFIQAVARLAANIEEIFNISCSFTGRKGIVVHETSTAIHLFHIIQEAITNAIKHGHAKSIRIHLSTRKDRLTLTVRDDGVGMPAEPHEDGGMGLNIMRHRARMVGATIEHGRGQDGGTVVTCTVHRLADENQRKRKIVGVPKSRAQRHASRKDLRRR
jgi:two-component system CheB/CheR fusion protein